MIALIATIVLIWGLFDIVAGGGMITFGIIIAIAQLFDKDLRD